MAAPTLYDTAGDQIAVGEQYRRLSFIRLDAGGVYRHHIGTIGEVGDATKAFGFALGAVDGSGAVEALELGIRGGVCHGLDLEPERSLWRLRDGQTIGRCGKLLRRQRCSI